MARVAEEERIRKKKLAEEEEGRRREEEAYDRALKEEERRWRAAEERASEGAEKPAGDAEAVARVKASSEPEEIVWLLKNYVGDAGVQEAGCKALNARCSTVDDLVQVGSNPSGKCSYERPTRGTVCGTMRSMCSADAGCLAINYQSLCRSGRSAGSRRWLRGCARTRPWRCSMRGAGCCAPSATATRTPIACRRAGGCGRWWRRPRTRTPGTATSSVRANRFWPGLHSGALRDRVSSNQPASGVCWGRHQATPQRARCE